MAATAESPIVVRHLRWVDDAGGQHLEGVNTGAWFVGAVEEGDLSLTGNIRPDWQDGQNMGAKTRRKVERWAEELLRNDAVMGNLSIRLDPSSTSYTVEEDEHGDHTLTILDGHFDCAVDSQSRIRAILMAAASPAGTFNTQTRFATRIWIASDDVARRVGSDYNTRGDKVNDTAAKFAYQDTPEKRIARKLLTDSRHLGIDNIEVLKNTVSASSSKLVAFNTLAEAMQSYWKGEPLNETQETEQSEFLVEYWDALVAVRKEFGRLGKSDRQALRGSSMAGTALSVHGVIAVANEIYARRLSPIDVLHPLADPVQADGKEIDYFSYDNPVWLKIGALALAEDRKGNVRRTLRMSFQTRDAMGEEMKRRVGLT